MAKKKTQRSTKASQETPPAQQKMTLADFQRRQRFFLRSPDVSYQHACHVMEKYRDELLKKKHVTGVDVGMKLQGPASTREFSVWVYVDQKLTDSEYKKLPKKDRIPEYLDDVPTDVHFANFEEAASEGTPGGTKITPKNETNWGTLGFDVFSHLDDIIRYLTCAHVASKNEVIVDETEMLVKSTEKSLGKVYPIRGVEWEFSNLLDCALIKPKEDDLPRVGIPDGFKQPVRIRFAYPSDVSSEVPVWKLGAATGLTTNGIIINHRSNSFQFRRADGSVMTAKDHIIAKPRIANGQLTETFAKSGDSGSILCIDDEAVGIVRAVDSARNLVAAVPLADAAAILGFGI